MAASQEKTTYAEPQYAQAKKKYTDFPFYTPNIDKYLFPKTQELLERYSGIPKDKQSEHVHKIRDQAFEIRKYPCTGLGVWLVPYISFSPAYHDILHRLKSGETFVDIGCFLGSDLRQLVFDGAPSVNMTGVDIVSHWDIGYELFQDKDQFKAKFIEADFLSDNPALKQLEGKINVISISAVLHQWDWDDQIEAAKKLVKFSKVGSIIIGHQIGNLKAQEIVNPSLRMKSWSHDVDSFARLWNKVSDETGTVWKSEAGLHTFPEMKWDPQDQAWMHPDTRVIDFVVTRSQ